MKMSTATAIFALAALAAPAAVGQSQLPFQPLRNFLATSKRGQFIRQHVDPALRADEERLRSLGYLQ